MSTIREQIKKKGLALQEGSILDIMATEIERLSKEVERLQIRKEDRQRPLTASKR